MIPPDAPSGLPPAAEPVAPPEEARGRAALTLVADAKLLASIARLEQATLVRTHTLPLFAREPKLHLDPADWRAGYLAVREREVLPDILAALREVSPQALLRDLYRPVRANAPVTLELHEGIEIDRGGRQAVALARAARTREPIPTVEPIVGRIVEEQARRRAFLKEEWKPTMPDDAPRREVDVARDTSDW